MGHPLCLWFGALAGPQSRFCNEIMLLTSGGYMESAAFNPSLPPLQAALVDAVIGGLREFAQVRLSVCVCAPICS